MISVSDYLIPLLLLALIIACVVRKIPAYEAFTEGAKGAVELCLNLFPYLVAIFLGVELFRVSGLSARIADFLAPAFSFIGIPGELCELVLLRPFSGSGSLAVLSDVLKTYGADSYIGKCASVIMGSSETIFYVAAVYFAGIKHKKLRWAIPIALFASLVGSIVGCLLCRLI